MSMKDPKKIQKYAFGFVITIGFFALLFGVIQFYYNVSSPFSGQGDDLALTNVEENKLLEDLKTVDTDQDGLNDYEELYFYNTSPYLEDSDSDGKTDKEEVEAGQDPNCPEGADCRGFLTNKNENSNTNASINSDTSLENVTPDELRQALRDAGASETVLNELDDQALMDLYGQVLSEESGLGNTNATNTSIPLGEDISMEELKNFTPDEIRALLISGGADEEFLNQVDDETLQQIYLEALDQPPSDT